MLKKRSLCLDSTFFFVELFLREKTTEENIYNMTDFEEDSEQNESDPVTEEHIWTNVGERPTGEDMDSERERMVRGKNW